MAKLLIKLKDPENRTHIRHLKDVMTNQLENDGLKDRFEIWSYMDILDNSQNAEQTLELIFNVIISVTMFICFFSLSSSMSGNLYEQVKEISVMRSIGFTKRIIMKLYIYEAFILVISGSFSGVLIGTCVGWSISVQRSMFVGMPTPLTFPFKEFFFILTVSIICAFLSTYGPSKNLMNRSIPDIARLT
jgi:ABC-type lipoprotein release transport system permease subunit